MSPFSGAWLQKLNRSTTYFVGWKSKSGRFGCLSLPVLPSHWASSWVLGLPAIGQQHRRHQARVSLNRGLRSPMYLPRFFRSDTQSTIESRSHRERSALFHRRLLFRAQQHKSATAIACSAELRRWIRFLEIRLPHGLVLECLFFVARGEISKWFGRQCNFSASSIIRRGAQGFWRRVG